MATEAATQTVPAKVPVAMNERGIQLSTMEDAYRFGKMMIDEGYAPSGFKKPSQVVLAVQTGAELGMGIMASMRHIPVIRNRPSIMGDAAKGLVRASGKLDGNFDVKYSGEGDDRTCTVTAKRKDSPTPATCSFSVADAKRAHLWEKDGPWTEYPDRMLYYRPLGFLLRDEFSDVLLGFAIAEEVRDFPDSAVPIAAQTPPEGPDPLLALPAAEESAPIDVESEPPAEPDPVTEDGGPVVDPETGEEIPDHILNPKD